MATWGGNWASSPLNWYAKAGQVPTAAAQSWGNTLKGLLPTNIPSASGMLQTGKNAAGAVNNIAKGVVSTPLARAAGAVDIGARAATAGVNNMLGPGDAAVEQAQSDLNKGTWRENIPNWLEQAGQGAAYGALKLTGQLRNDTPFFAESPQEIKANQVIEGMKRPAPVSKETQQGQNFIDELTGANMTPEQVITANQQMEQRRINADVGQVAKQIQDMTRQEEQARAAEAGNTIEYGRDGSRTIKSGGDLPRTAEGMLYTQGIGGGTFASQLENMQNMRARSDMMDQIDYMQRDVQRGPTGVGDIPRWQASAQMLNNLLKQAGPGGTAEQEQTKAAAEIAKQESAGRWGMRQQGLTNEGAMEREKLQSGDRRYTADVGAESKSAELQQKALLGAPEYATKMLELQVLSGQATPAQVEAYRQRSAAVKGTQPSFRTAEDMATGQTILYDQNNPQNFTRVGDLLQIGAKGTAVQPGQVFVKDGVQYKVNQQGTLEAVNGANR